MVIQYCVYSVYSGLLEGVVSSQQRHRLVFVLWHLAFGI